MEEKYYHLHCSQGPLSKLPSCVIEQYFFVLFISESYIMFVVAATVFFLDLSHPVWSYSAFGFVLYCATFSFLYGFVRTPYDIDFKKEWCTYCTIFCLPVLK